MERQSLPERYLMFRRRLDEATSLGKVRGTEADLRVWRRDPGFRDGERAAIAAPPAPAQCHAFTFADVFGHEDGEELDEEERLENARLREQLRERELGRYERPPADQYGATPVSWWQRPTRGDV
jgi:hypothetical protein